MWPSLGRFIFCTRSMPRSQIFVPLIERHDGILLKAEADSLLVIFGSPDPAMACAVAMQKGAMIHNQKVPPEEQVLLCFGLGYGDMLLVGDEDVFGAEVNAASKLGEDTAKAHEILVTEQFREGLTGVGGLEFEKIEFVPPGGTAAYKVGYRLS